MKQVKLEKRKDMKGLIDSCKEIWVLMRKCIFRSREMKAVAQRGRKPKPTAVKVLEGNPGKRCPSGSEPKP